MRIAMLNPTYWPEVRRGSERLIHDLGVALVRRGHEVTLLTTHRRRSSESVENGIRVLRRRRPPELPRIRDYEYFAANAPIVATHLLKGGYDIAHAFFPVDAWAAAQAKRLGGPRFVFSFHGTPLREYLVVRRGRLQMIERAVAEAAAVSVLSEAAAGPFRRFLLHDPFVVGGGVRCADFAVEQSRAAVPTLVCAASLGDPRKRGELLLEAFAELRRRIPAVRLILAGGKDPFGSRIEPELPAGVSRADPDSVDALARAYASSWASVLPAIEEAFGLVLVESLAAGTPAIAARSGACPEILTEEAHGTLFEPDDSESLAAAMEGALGAPPSGDVAAACRRRAAEFDWDLVVERYEELYDVALRRSPVG